MTPQVTISIPYWRSQSTIRRAVESALNQTVTDIEVVVVNDGDLTSPPWPALEGIDDPRLIRLDLPINRGRYFTDAVTLAGCRSTWWTIVDADDYLDPHHLANLLAASEYADVVMADQIVHTRSAEKVESVSTWDGTAKLAHHCHMGSLWRTSWLRQVGGPHPGYRVGYDSMLSCIAWMCGRVAVVRTPTYHRVRRQDSLTTSRATGWGSPARKEAIRQMSELLPSLAAASPDPVAVGDLVRATIADELANEVRLHAGRLPAPPSTRTGTVHVADRGLWADGWALPAASAAELDARLATLQPRVVVEAGSGASTLLLAAYAAKTGATVVSLEHHPTYHRGTLDLLTRHALADRVDLRLAPLVPHPAGPWYDADLPDSVELAVVDGPPERDGGRAAALPALLPHLRDGWELWLDDASRPGESAALRAWADQYRVHVDHLPVGRGIAVVRPTQPAARPVDASQVTLTILTGSRPDLLDATLTSLADRAPGLIESAAVRVLVNGGDPDTLAVADKHDLGAATEITDSLEPIGPAVSRLAAWAADSGRPYWLHLEDDWTIATGHTGWLDEAIATLADHPSVSQVRLRHYTEPVLDRHMATGRRIAWRPHAMGVVAEAHWTLNPALMRTVDIGRVWPASGERHAQRRAHQAGMRTVVQHLPGVWVHIGGGRSLRLATGSVS